jgi:hypothetical protein
MIAQIFLIVAASEASRAAPLRIIAIKHAIKQCSFYEFLSKTPHIAKHSARQRHWFKLPLDFPGLYLTQANL